MREALLSALRAVTQEERELLQGKELRRARYTSGRDFTIDGRKFLQGGKLMAVRAHTRFVAFPCHRHNYVEILYMCEGSTTHILNGTERVTLRAGELLFLNQHCTHEIEPAGLGDVCVNFMVMPRFFHTAFDMMETGSALDDFIAGSLMQGDVPAKFLHYRVSDVVPVQNLVENMVWTLMNEREDSERLNRITMGLLLQTLLGCGDRVDEGFPGRRMSGETARILAYIEEHYADASLDALARREGVPAYRLSRAVRRDTGYTFKELLQLRRFQAALTLLRRTPLSVSDVIATVGYENTSYFYRRFRALYQMSPGEYRAAHAEHRPEA